LSRERQNVRATSGAIPVTGCLGLFLLCGCVQSDFAAPFGTEFKAISAGKFEYVAQTTPSDPVSSDEGERVRLHWLERYLKQQDLCRAGYVIESRHATPEFNKRNPGYVAGAVRYRIDCSQSASLVNQELAMNPRSPRQR
jgi:hypothetical protein